MKDRHIVYQTQGVCAKSLEFDLVDGCVFNVRFNGGCKGNTTGVARLSEGQDAQTLIRLLKGVDCHGGNSCPNQFALALEEALGE